MIKRQSDEITSLKKKINDLNVTCEQKDELLSSVDSLQKELVNTIDDIKKKSKEYDKLIEELMSMRKIMNVEVFKGRWNIIKWLLK